MCPAIIQDREYAYMPAQMVTEIWWHHLISHFCLTIFTLITVASSAIRVLVPAPSKAWWTIQSPKKQNWPLHTPNPLIMSAPKYKVTSRETSYLGSPKDRCRMALIYQRPPGDNIIRSNSEPPLFSDFNSYLMTNLKIYYWKALASIFGNTEIQLRKFMIHAANL